MESYSVLMTVYREELPEHFAQAVQSMLDQTLPPDDFVIVCDGPLTEEIDRTILAFQKQCPGLFQVCRLPKNVGIGKAANEGIALCKNDLIARMDADDIALPQRCEKQVERFAQVQSLTVLGGYIEEFTEKPDHAFASRIVPTTNDKIRGFARRRQPFNNVTVMLRKSAVLEVGGYRSLRRAEDYDLYIRLLHAGYYAENIPEVLVKVRVNITSHKRRSSVATLSGCIVSRWRAFRLGYSSLLDFLYCAFGGLLVFLCPYQIQHWLYKKFLRDNPLRGESRDVHIEAV